DWNVQLKQEGLVMEKEAKYKVNFKIASSIDRDVRLALMGAGDAWCGGSDIQLTKNKLKSFSQIVTLNENYVSGTIAFQISMGQLGDEKLEAHAIEISEISITKVEDSTEADEIKETDYEIEPPKNSGDDPNSGDLENPKDPDDKENPENESETETTSAEQEEDDSEQRDLETESSAQDSIRDEEETESPEKETETTTESETLKN
ncbi:MAG: hypothetical protein K2M91_06440, partial [Lachnospiraceae bacterium]|nr:hypothetical protein [Lachnospiraceae bacterium]